MTQATANHAPARAWTQAEAMAFIDTLRSQLHASGVFTGDKRMYIGRAGYVLIVSMLAFWGFSIADTWGARIALSVLAGYIGVQAAAIGHEAGHGAVSRSRAWRHVVGQVFMTLVLGNSYSAWVERHGAHHIHPNSRQDPDVRPWLFSFNETDAGKATGLAGWCTRHQHQLLYPLSTLMGFSLKVSGWRAVLRDPLTKWVDLLLLLLHVAVWVGLPALWIGLNNSLVNYLLLTWVEGAYLSFVFLANHLGGPTGEEASEWPPALRQIVTARNLSANRLLGHFCIGLNTHIEHHLFGHLSANRLHEARAITRSLCEIHGIPYRECGVVQAFSEVHQYNRRMARIACIAHDCLGEKAAPLGDRSNS
jgi:fatty acid desaturase